MRTSCLPARAMPDPFPPTRLATGADAAALDAWLQSRQPLAVPAARARRAMLDALLGQGGQGLCVVADHPDGAPRACVPVTLAPSLSLYGQACCITEWWSDRDGRDDREDEPALDACLDLLADWCRAHGVRHILLAPGLRSSPPDGFAPHPGGMWHASTAPAAKVLG